jgi:DNA-binding transcriptional regulator YhcF (GntR family)
MDTNNVVLSNAKIREDFIFIINKATNGELTYTHNTVKKAFQILVKKNLLVTRKQRGSYIVNPEYFFKRDEKDRIKQIKLILENK